MLPCFDGQIQWLRDQKQWTDMYPEAESWRREKHISLHRFLLLCLHSLVYCLKNRFLIQTASRMIRIAMAIKPWWVTHAELMLLRKCVSQRGGKVCIFYSHHEKKVNLLSLVTFLNGGTWWLNPSSEVRDEHLRLRRGPCKRHQI